MLIICVTFKVHEAHVESFRESILNNASTSLRVEVGCVKFDVSQSSDGTAFFLYEQYVDDQAFDLHLRAPHFLAFDKQSTPWVESKKVQRYYLLDQQSCAALP